MGFVAAFSKGQPADCFAKSNVVVVTSHIAAPLESSSNLAEIILARRKIIPHYSEYGRIMKFLRKFDDGIRPL
ncbi:hypothetical protein [Sinorhizobium americanum]|uniref:hypothetical protein n=1 Tax=Sinorhizobium americanum TaxID=194963 RepID=UPI00104F1B1E|nr:hypothetical protein [Sinorhizobium americanum]